MRALVAFCFCSVALSCASAARYEGIVVRASDSRPLAGIRVAAILKPPFFTFGMMEDTPLARQISDRNGRFHFELDQPPSRLYFSAMGKVTRKRLDSSTTSIYGGGATLDRPRPKKLNILRMPDADIPRWARIQPKT